MTKAEMNRRLAAMDPKTLARVERLVRQSSYDPRELAEVARVRLAHVNAVFQKVASE